MIVFYLLVLVLPWSESLFWERPIGGISLVIYLGAICTIIALAQLPHRATFPPLFSTWQARGFWLLSVAMIVSEYFRGGGLRGDLISEMALLIVTAILVDGVGTLHRVVLLSAAGVTVSSLAAVHQWWAYHGVYADFRTWGGWSGDGNSFALIATMWLPCMFVLMISRRPKWERWFLMGCCLVTGAGVMLAASRGALLGLGAGFLVLVLRSRRKALLLSLGLVVLLAASVGPTSAVRRLIHPDESDRVSSDARVDLWKVSLQTFEQHPFTGVGMVQMMTALQKDVGYHLSHNTYLELAAELGLVGIVPFLGIVIASYRGLARAARRARLHGPPLLFQITLGLEAGLVAGAVSGFFMTAWWIRSLWLMVFLSICVGEIEVKARRQAARREAVTAELPVSA